MSHNNRRQTLSQLSPGQLNARAGCGAGAGRVAAPVPGKEAASRKSTVPTANGMMDYGMVDARRSSAYQSGKGSVGTGGPKQDPRPITDKGFVNGCIRTLITYLSTHGYPAAVSPKTLTSPTAKDFTLVVQFLFQKFDPRWGCGGA